MTLPDDTLNIDTPENVVFGYEIAGIGSRFMAALLDTFLISLLQVAAFFVLVMSLSTVFEDIQSDAALAWVAAGLALLAFAFYWGYYIFFEMLWNGQSPGKRMIGLRVIRTNGLPVGLAEATIRNLVRLVDFLPAYYGVGIIVMFINAQSRRLGDLAAGTLVVRDRAAISLDTLEREQRELARQANQGVVFPSSPIQPAGELADMPISGFNNPAPLLPIERLNTADIHMAEDFLRRRSELANRSQLAVHIAAQLCRKMEIEYRYMSIDEAEKLISSVIQSTRSR